MEVHIRGATEDDKGTLTNLFELYTYDFSELMGVARSDPDLRQFRSRLGAGGIPPRRLTNLRRAPVLAR